MCISLGDTLNSLQHVLKKDACNRTISQLQISGSPAFGYCHRIDDKFEIFSGKLGKLGSLRSTSGRIRLWPQCVPA